MINGHGNERYFYGNSVVADFSSNVWFGGPQPELIDHLKASLPQIRNYPEPDARSLCLKIAEFHQVDHQQVLAFNGSVEAFYTIALAFRESISAILIPGFAEYEDACRIHQHQLHFFRNKDWKQTLNANPKLIWIGNPNNPDGSVFSFQELKTDIEANPTTIFVIDEAYAGFFPEFRSAIELTKTFVNLIVVRSLTKCCAIPGLRLGFVITSEVLADQIKQFQQPWSVNVLAQEAGIFLLKSGIDLDVKRISKLSFDLQSQINRIDGFRVIGSKAPFFLIEMQKGNAAQLKAFLLDEHGILIRDASNFRGLNEGFFRVCTRNENDNQLLLEGLKCYSIKFNHSKQELKPI